MIASSNKPSGGSMAEEKEPWLQRLYDRPFVLLALGLIVMFAFYTVWGMLEIMNMPQSTLP
jgi:hypothetical protein